MLLRAPLSFVSATARGSAPGASPSPSSDSALPPASTTPHDGHDALPAAEFAAWTRTASAASNDASRVQARHVASMAAGLLGASAFDDEDKKEDDDGGGGDKVVESSGKRSVPTALSFMAAAVADSASPLLRRDRR
jgi:hypothetical protein